MIQGFFAQKKTPSETSEVSGVRDARQVREPVDDRVDDTDAGERILDVHRLIVVQSAGLFDERVGVMNELLEWGALNPARRQVGVCMK